MYTIPKLVHIVFVFQQVDLPKFLLTKCLKRFMIHLDCYARTKERGKGLYFDTVNYRYLTGVCINKYSKALHLRNHLKETFRLLKNDKSPTYKKLLMLTPNIRFLVC